MATEIEPKLEKSSEEVEIMEKKIPVFTVLKNNSILKNIFLIDNPPTNSAGSSFELEEVLVVGRHPDCNITLEHPSISRFHLRIHSVPSLQSLSVFDLSSVHGTWVSGKKVEPGVRVELHEGDTLQLGASTRVYRLHWVPVSRVYDMKNPFVPPLSESEPVDDWQGETHALLDDDVMHLQDDETETPADYFEGLDLLFSDTNMMSSMRQLTPSAPLMPEDTKSPLYFEENAENMISFRETLQLSEIAEMQPVRKLDEENSNLDQVPVSCAYDMKNPFVPSLDKREPVEKRPEETHKTLDPDEVSFQDDQTDTLSDYGDGLDLLFVDMHMMSPKKQLTPSAPLMPEDMKSPFSFEEDAENKISLMETLQQSETARMKPDRQLDKVNSKLQVDFTSPDVHTFPQAGDADSPPVASQIRSGVSIWKRRGKSASVEVQTCRARENCRKAHTNHGTESESNKNVSSRSSHLVEDLSGGADWVEEVFSPDKENGTPDALLLNGASKEISEKILKHELSVNSLLSSMDEEGEEAFTPEKENMTPKTHLLCSIKKMGNLEKINQPKTYRSSPLKNAGSITHEDVRIPVLSANGNHLMEVLQEKILRNSGSSSQARSAAEVSKVSEHRMPFQSLLVHSNKMKSEASQLEGTMKSCKSVGNMHIKESIDPVNISSKGESKMWTMVVDTACLLNKESRKALQLMQGLHGTSLIIPGIVIRELNSMNRHYCLFRRTSGVTSALQWIEDCMVNTEWWIHVQSSVEDPRPIAPTPRAWPLPQLSAEEKEKFSVSSVPFSPCGGSFLDIVSPTTEDHILECALFFRKTLNKGQFVLLSDDVTLKIKAMAEGVPCETAKELRDTLVNPFSERFLWNDSSPRGHTWFCHDDVVLREKYYSGPSRKQSKLSEAAKGLKLILLHNSSHYKQNSTLS